MDLPRALEAFSTFEKRAMAFYRRLGSRFQDPPGASLLWIEMSNAEAAHFAVVTLAQDWIHGKGAPPPPLPEMTQASLDALAQRFRILERRAEADHLTLADAVELAMEWEATELPPVLALVSAIPHEAAQRLRAGLLNEAASHYRCLKELAALAGVTSLDSRLDALRKTAADAARTSA